MSVSLSPSSQLGFQRPLTTLVKRTLAVSNHNTHAIAYKVKTTAPKQYCVRPNSGRIEPGETVEVQVLLQPMKEDPPANTKCRDKFLVQSVVITPERENIPLTELWGVVEKDKESANGVEQIHEQKIRCTYLPAADEPVNQSIPEEQFTPSKADTTANPDSSFVSTINSTAPSSNPTPASASAAAPSSPPVGMPALGEPTAAVQPRVQARDISSAPSSSSTPSSASTLPSTSTPSQSSPTTSSSTSAAAASYVDTAREKATAAATLASGALATAAVTAASGLSNVAHSIDPNVDSTSSTKTGGGGGDEVSRLRAELSRAKSEISRLESQLATSGGTGLRNRGTGPAANAAASNEGVNTSSKVVEMQGAEGVPVQTVAAIAFAVFLFTWMFL